MLDGPRVVVAQGRPGAWPARAFGADPRPAHATALGQALLAFSPAAVVAEVVAAGAASRHADALTSPDRLRRALAVTRLTRVAVSRCEHSFAVAVPVFGSGGAVLGALELEVHDLRSGLAEARGALMVAAGSLSRMLATAPPRIHHDVVETTEFCRSP